MKILLISINTCTQPFPIYPLGMSVVANILTKNGDSVHQFDFLANNQSYAKVKKSILDFNPQLIGISLRNHNEKSIETANKIIKIARKLNKQTFIGGSGCSVYSSSPALQKINADFYIIGPAESNIIKFINDLEKGIYPKNKIIEADKYTEIYGPLYDKDILKFYSSFNEAIGLNTKRGCSNNCFYCNYKYIDGNAVKYRKIKDIINDLLFLKENKVNSIFFADSILNDDKKFLKELLTEMEKANININWSGYLRPDTIDKTLLKLMKRTGISTVSIGIDGTTDETLKGYNKNFKWKDVLKIDKMLFEQKFENTRADFLFGGPKETKETVLKGIENIKKLHFKTVNINVFCLCIKDNKIIKQEDICDLDNKWITDKLVHAFGKLGDVKLNN